MNSGLVMTVAKIANSRQGNALKLYSGLTVTGVWKYLIVVALI